jgi:hypothetical protein
MIDTYTKAVAEQQAAAVPAPDGSPLYSAAQQEQYRRAALHLRHAAVSLEAVATATDVRLARASLAGAYRFLKEARRLVAEAVGGEGGG